MLIQQLDGYVSTLKRALGDDDFAEIIPLIVFDKLDAITKDLWYNNYTQEAKKWAGLLAARSEGVSKVIEASDYVPNWPNTRAFLLQQMLDLKRLQSDNQMRPADMRDTGTKRKEYCTRCGALHRLYKCGDYRAMPLARRWAHVTQNNLCERCLHPKHLGQCNDENNNNQCETCKKHTEIPAYHNSTLCRYIVKNW